MTLKFLSQILSRPCQFDFKISERCLHGLTTLLSRNWQKLRFFYDDFDTVLLRKTQKNWALKYRKVGVFPLLLLFGKSISANNFFGYNFSRIFKRICIKSAFIYSVKNLKKYPQLCLYCACNIEVLISQKNCEFSKYIYKTRHMSFNYTCSLIVLHLKIIWT